MDAFRTADRGVSRSVQVGTGLGLAIVQKVVEGYNGKINIMSSKGKGTTLIINFPKVDNVPESESRH